MFARDTATHKNLNLQFENRLVKKVYSAIILGSVKKYSMVVDASLFLNGDRRHRTIIDFQRGKQARTIVKCIKLYKHVSFVEIEPKTGYTHQIRAHLAYIYHPIIGVDLYGRTKTISWALKPERMYLHCQSINFIDPISGKNITITSPIPSEFSSFLNKIERMEVL